MPVFTAHQYRTGPCVDCGFSHQRLLEKCHGFIKYSQFDFLAACILEGQRTGKHPCFIFVVCHQKFNSTRGIPHSPGCIDTGDQQEAYGRRRYFLIILM